jgi:hypothetical protein
MRITIDTKEDSPEDIRKAIQLLSHLVEGKTESKSDKTRNIFEDTQKTEGSVFGAIFDSGEKKEPEAKPDDTDEEVLRIIPY